MISKNAPAAASLAWRLCGAEYTVYHHKPGSDPFMCIALKTIASAKEEKKSCPKMKQGS